MVQVLRLTAAACFSDEGLHIDHPCLACLASGVLRQAADEMERA